jgi:hypothetical protein
VRKRDVAAAHCAYDVCGGLWPFLSMRTFLLVTGRKRELWLVRNLSWLMVVIGAVLGLGARRENPGGEMTLLGAGSAAVFAGVEVWYAVVRRRIAPTYLVDGLVVSRAPRASAMRTAANSRFGSRPSASPRSSPCACKGAAKRCRGRRDIGSELASLPKLPFFRLSSARARQASFDAVAAARALRRPCRCPGARVRC